MSWLGGDDSGGDGVNIFGGGADYPWWAAEEKLPVNITCDTRVPDYHAATAVTCAMFLVFGIIYSFFGYRIFKAVMFLTGFLFASVVVYLICLSEALLPLVGNTGVAVGAGILFGLITMLVQYVGLFMTGFHTGLFLGIALVAALHPWWLPPSVWSVVGIMLASGLIMAISTLYFQKGLTIIGTAVSGGAIIAATLDYFIEELLMVEWFRHRLMGREKVDPLCWFSWLLLGTWPFMVLVGSLTQWKISGRGIYHQQMITSVKSRNVSLQRLRSREARAEMRQKKYRYLYQVRTAHGDIISQEYIQSLQRKAYPASVDNGTLQSDSTHTTMLVPDHNQLAPLTESEDEGATHSGFQSPEEEPMAEMYSKNEIQPTGSGHQHKNYRYSYNLQPTPPPSPASPYLHDVPSGLHSHFHH